MHSHAPHSHHAKPLSALAIAATLALFPTAKSSAATLQWSGLGSSASWSDAFNWNPVRAPADGDDLLFGGAPPRTTSLFDLARSFSSMSFSADAAPFVTHVSGSGAQLAFSGAGISSLSAVGSPPVRQRFFADAGSTGGTILFTHSSGLNVGSPPFARAVDLTAQGGGAGAIGGHIVFQDASATGGATFDALRAEGASAAAVTGATGGELIFRDNALATKTSSVTVTGGTAAGALGGQAGFSGQARAAGNLNLLAGALGGLGGRIDFAGNAVATETVNLSVQGAGSAIGGAEGAISFRGDARLLGGAFLGEGTAGGASGGRLEFFGRASHDSSGLNPALGIIAITAAGSSVANAGGGMVVFHDDAFVLGTQLFIANATSEGATALSFGGNTSFLDRSRAGQATVQNAGTGAAGARGGTTNFRDQANAERASIVSQGGFASGAAGGSTQFSDDASAGSATLRTEGGSAAGALGGSVGFEQRATAGGASIVNGGGAVAGALGGTAAFGNSTTAGTATIVNAPGQVLGAEGGVTTFSGHAGAGSAFISNDTSLGTGGGGAGRILFRNNASAQQASIDNQGGFNLPASQSNFYEDASAGNARITNFGGKAAGVYGGFTIFFDRASANAASIVTAGGGVDRSLGGVVEFFSDSTAGSATIDLRSAGVAGAGGALAFFDERSNAGSASFLVQGSQVNTLRGTEAASVTFEDVASAANARFTIGGNRFAGGAVGEVAFTANSTAANASFDLLAGQDRGGSLRFNGTDALHLASAGSATVHNRGSASGAVGLSIGGVTNFQNNATADAARITNEAGVTFGFTSFFGNSVAGAAVILNAGGRDGESGGATQFNSAASADRAVIDNQAGARRANGFDAAGSTRFANTASAGSANITARGAASTGDIGGLIAFGDTSSAAGAVLVAEGGRNGGSGGRIRFTGAASGGSARLLLSTGLSGGTGGELDISALTGSGTGTGSIEGGGSVRLGSKTLTVGANGLDTTFSGVIADGGTVPGSGGSLTVIGAGRLTLTGANAYTGATHIGDGINAGSGKLVAANSSGSATGSGAVFIERGGTLGGSGFIAGPVTLRAGGTLAPGDPVTLTLRSSLTWDGGGVIRLVLGADSAGSDHLDVGSLLRGTDGAFTFDLVDAGIVAGASYDLLRAGSLVGFTSADFSFTGAAGSFALDSSNGSLAFTAAVPEPGSAALLALGLGVVFGAARWRVSPPPARGAARRGPVPSRA